MCVCVCVSIYVCVRVCVCVCVLSLIWWFSFSFKELESRRNQTVIKDWVNIYSFYVLFFFIGNFSHLEEYFWNIFFHYIYIYIYMVRSKSPKPHQESQSWAFCCGNTLLLLIKLGKRIQISVLTSVHLRPLQRSEVYDKSKIWDGIEVFERLFFLVLWHCPSIFVSSHFLLFHSLVRQDGKIHEKAISFSFPC